MSKAGAPRLGEEKLLSRTVRLGEKEYAKFLRLGGAAWLRSKLAETKDPKGVR
jgi:hypothetical protein